MIRTDIINSMTQHIIDENGGYEACSLPLPEFGRYINPSSIPGLTDSIMVLIAEVVATLIDAGSEREAVMESAELHDAIVDELNGWTNR